MRDRLAKDPHVLFCFLSPTGSGLKVGFRVPADDQRHSDSFAAVAAHVKEVYDEEIDQACKNLSRLCFVSHDPDLYVNWDAEEMQVTKAPKPLKLTNNIDLAPRKKIAEEMFGPVDWVDETTGNIRCPGQESHTNPDAPQDCQIHIDGAFVMLNPGLALVDPAQLPYWFLQKLISLGIDTIEISPTDNSWIINCLAVSPGRVIMSEGASPRITDELTRHKVEILPLAYDRVQLNGGGIHCSTCPLIRDAV